MPTGPTRQPVSAGHWPAVAAVVLAALLFAFNGVVAKVAIQSGLGTTRLVQLRTLGAAIVLVGVATALGPSRLRLDRRSAAALGVLGVVGVACVQWLYFVSISRLPVGLALLLEYTAPLLVALWARFVLHEKVRGRVWLALLACLVGLTMVAQVKRGVALDAVGVAAALAAAVALATYYLLGERLLARRDAWSTQAWSMAFAAVFWAVAAPVWRADPAALGAGVALPDPVGPAVWPLWVLVGWVVLLGTVAPYILVVYGLARLGSARTGLLAMLEPVAAAAAAWVVLGESMTALQVAGGGVVLVGVMLAETSRTHPVPDDDAPALLPDTVAA